MSLNEILNRYLSNFFIQNSCINDDMQPPVSTHPVLQIPKWNYLDSTPLSLSLSDFGLLLIGKSNCVTVISNMHIYEYCDLSLLQLIDLLEAWIEKTQFPDDFFYGMFISYDAGLDFENIPRGKDLYELPDYVIWFPGNGILNWNNEKTIYRTIFDKPITLSNLENSSARIFDKIHGFLLNPQDYTEKIHGIKKMIRDGEYYQINFTMPYVRKTTLADYEIFHNLYQLNPAPFSVFANFGHFSLISNSPERFIAINDKHLFTQPIKGTIGRSVNPEQDRRLATWLKHSEKNSAELSMIVDLLRNDISTFCQPGSVQVTKHKEVQSFENVHHLVSTVRGSINPGTPLSRMIRGVFPGGSITGCPKIAAMQAITELEVGNRSYYTGGFFLRFPGLKKLDSNILIRTGIKIGSTISFPVGGGIVFDSHPTEEYHECLAKANSFLKVKI